MEVYDNRGVIAFRVAGDPVPWSAPDRGRWGGSLPNNRLVEWQSKISDAARDEFGPKVPWTGPVVLRAVFFIRRAMPKSAKSGDLVCPEFTWDEAQSMFRMKGKAPDLTNLIKAAEDALESIVVVNDAQVAMHSVCQSVWDRKNPGIHITVTRKWPWTANEKSA